MHYYNQRFSGEGELIGSEHTGALTQWLSSEIKLRGGLLHQMNYIVARVDLP